MTTDAKLVKVAVIREPGAPMGVSAPLYLNCPCGARPRVPFTVYRNTIVTCGDAAAPGCGRRYTLDGWMIEGGTT